MPTCGLCTAKKHKVYILCDSCHHQPRICMQCWASMLFMCPIERSCTKLHLLCPYCKHVIENIDRLKNSSYYTEHTIKLLTHQLQNIHKQRDTPYRVWEHTVNARTSQESIFSDDSDDSEWFSKVSREMAKKYLMAQKYLKKYCILSLYRYITVDSIAVFLKTWSTYLFIHPQSHVYSIFCHLLLFKLTHFPLSVPSRDIYGDTHWLNPFESAHAHDSSRHSWQSYQTSIGFPPCSKQNKAVFHLCLIPLSFLVLAGIVSADIFGFLFYIMLNC